MTATATTKQSRSSPVAGRSDARNLWGRRGGRCVAVGFIHQYRGPGERHGEGSRRHQVSGRGAAWNEHEIAGSGNVFRDFDRARLRSLLTDSYNHFSRITYVGTAMTGLAMFLGGGILGYNPAVLDIGP